MHYPINGAPQLPQNFPGTVTGLPQFGQNLGMAIPIG